jgi:putative ABC transport system ATP-binding protein
MALPPFVVAAPAPSGRSASAGPSAEVTIEAENVCKSFGTGQRQTLVLRGVGLAVSRGETVFFVGPSGSGKTTLLSVLGCILTPDAGTVRVLGRDVSRMGARELTTFRRENLGFIFQSFNLFPTLWALDNIRLTLTMRGLPLRTATDQAADLLNQMGLWHRSHLRPGQLSTGECQRVAIARALADNPAVLFADEPTASLDAENGQAAMALLSRQTRERGVTLVVVTHDNRIFPYADRILHLEDGYLTHEWAPDPSEAPAVEAVVAARGLPPGRLRFLKECVR